MAAADSHGLDTFGAERVYLRENAGKMRSLRGLTLFRDNFGSGPWRIHWWHPFKNE